MIMEMIENHVIMQDESSTLQLNDLV